MTGWIGVDLDGTLAEYHGWPADGSIGKPIPAMVDRVKRWLEEGKDVRIFTARVWPQGADVGVAKAERFLDSLNQITLVESWCEANLGRNLPITCVKDFGMIELWDDRAVQVRINTGERVDGTEEKLATASMPVDRSARVLTDGSPVTDDHREIDPATGQQKAYVVLTAAERAKGFVRPVRRAYKHKTCGAITSMGLALAETYARDPGFYDGTFCATCRAHFPLAQFLWEGTEEQVGT